MKLATLGRLVAATLAVAAVAATAPSPAVASATASAQAVAALPVNGGFTSLSPVRVLDTRNGTGGVPVGQVAARGTLSFDVAGHGGVPGSGVSAVVLNVTVTGTTSSGFITAFPGGTTRPVASNLNFAAGQTVANLVTVKLGGTGQVSLFNGSLKGVHLVADVSGYYQDGLVTDAGAFVPVAPARILDTRNRIGTNSTHPVAAAGKLTLQVTGAGGVPSSGVRAVVMNVTATAATRAGYITVFSQGTAQPTASNLNFTPGRNVPNLVTVGLGATGQAVFYNGSSGTVHLIADVAGYYLAGTATKAGTFIPVAPTRLLDTRVLGKGTPSTAPVPALKDLGLQILDGTAVPLTNVSAVVTNVTAVGETRSGYITAYPTAPTRPLVSTLNHAAAQTIANLAIVQPGLCGKVTLFNGSGGSTHLIADVSGYFLAKTIGAGGTQPRTGLAWGDNGQGELGTGTVKSSKTPAPIPQYLHDLRAIDGNGLAVSLDGNVWAWGPDELVQLYGRNPSTDVGFGNCSIPERIGGGISPTISAVAGTPSDAFALDGAGDVWSWGLNDQGQLGNGSTTDSFTPAKVPGLTTTHAAVAIGAGLALLNDGTVWAWGDNSAGQLGLGGVGSAFSPTAVQVTGLSNVTAIAQIGDTNYALVDPTAPGGADATVWAWGSNANGALGQNISVPDSPTPLQVVGVGGIGFLTNVTAISGGMALLGDGSIVTWGDNGDGQLGNGTTAGHTNEPEAVVPPTGVTLPAFTAIAAGGNVDVALGTDRSVWAWGAAHAGGANVDSGVPTLVIAGAVAPGGANAVGAGVSAAFAIIP